MKKLLFIPLVLLLSACGPRYAKQEEYFAGYQGETAVIRDSMERQHRGKVHVYFVEEINGKPVENSNARSSAASYGQGPALTAIKLDREIPANKVFLKIVGKTLHAAPIQAMFGSNYRIQTDFELTAKAGEVYVVRGWLSDNYSALWLEDSSGEKVSKLFEKVKDSDVSVEEYREKINKISYKTENLTTEQKFLRIEPGESVDYLMKTLGEPEKIDEVGSNFFLNRPGYKWYYYSQLGKIKVSNINTVISVEPALNNDSFSAEKISQALSTNQGTIVQLLAKKYYNADIFEQNPLDAMAAKIWHEYKTEDRYMVDGVAWLCKTLGKSGSARYRDLLSKIASEATESKLRKYAKLSLEQLSSDEVEQFKAP